MMNAARRPTVVVLRSTLCGVAEVDWSYRADYMRERHGIEVEWADEALEDNRDAPIPEGAKVTRPNRGRSTVYSIRLNPDEVAALQSIADAAGVPGSTLARSWIVERIQEEQAGLSDAEAELRAAQRHLTHLQRHLRQQASSS